MPYKEYRQFFFEILIFFKPLSLKNKSFVIKYTKEGVSMSIENVKTYFKNFHMEGRILELKMSSATVELAAKAVGTKKERIAKSLSFLVENNPIIIVCAGDAKIYSSAFKREFHTKPKMIPKEKVKELIGHDIGGVCPFAVKEEVRVYLDLSLQRFETVFPACGSSNSAIELTIDELERYSNSIKWVDVCKIKKEGE